EGESPRDHGESLSSSRKNGPRVEEVAAGGAPGGVAVCLCSRRFGITPRLVTHAPFGAPLPLTKGKQTKSSPRAAARERGRLRDAQLAASSETMNEWPIRKITENSCRPRPVSISTSRHSGPIPIRR